MQHPHFKTFISTGKNARRVANTLTALGCLFTTHQEYGYIVFRSTNWMAMEHVIRRVYGHEIKSTPNIVEAFGPEKIDILIDLLDNSGVNYTLRQSIGETPTIVEPTYFKDYDIYYML